MSLLIGEYSDSSDEDVAMPVASDVRSGAASVAPPPSEGAVASDEAASGSAVPVTAAGAAAAATVARLQDLVFSDTRGPLPAVAGNPTASMIERVRRLEQARMGGAGGAFLQQRQAAPEFVHASVLSRAAAAGGVADVFVSHVPRDVFDRAAFTEDTFFDKLPKAPGAVVGGVGFVAAVGSTQGGGGGGGVGGSAVPRPSRWNT